MEAIAASSIGDILPVGGKGKKKNVPWEYIALAALGGATIVTGTMLAVQWKHASVGRKVENDVVSFLKHYGATINGKKISGGPINVPVTVEEAVTGTVNSMIKDVHARVAAKKAHQQAQGQAPAQPQGAPDAIMPIIGGAPGAPGGLVPQMMAPAPPAGPQPRSPKMTGMQVTGGASGMTAPAGSLQPESTGVRGAQPEFPEAPISGKTGRPATHHAEEPHAIGTMTRDSESFTADGVDQDYSYAAPTPPGMHMPPGGRPPMD